MSENKLTEQDHNQMDEFLGTVLEDLKNGEVTKEAVASGLSHVIAAVDIGNHEEARSWFKNGHQYIRDQSEKPLGG